MTIRVSGPALAVLNRTSPTYTLLQQSLKPLAEKDATLWGEAATTEARLRLNWIDLPDSSRELLPQLDALYAWSRSKKIDHLILCGMGGSSLAPEVIAKVYKKELVVLDSTDPEQISAGIPADLSTTLVVVGSKSGSTIETASQRAFFSKLITDAGLAIEEHMVIVTDPGSPLDKDARSLGLRVINADPDVGGRFSALSAFGLVPAALMGVDISLLLDDAAEAARSFIAEPSAALDIATILYEMSEQAVAFYDAGSPVPGLSDWIEQLVAESTGKDQKGRIPVVIESAHSSVGGRVFTVAFSGGSADLIVEAPLGAQFILWEWVTALLSKAIGIDPFNQPNVTEAKERTGALLANWSGQNPVALTPSYETEFVQVFGNCTGSSLNEIAQNFLAQENYYFALMAYLHRGADDQVTQLREIIAQRTEKPTTFGWGPRFLHSTGQFHKGGQPNGAFIQISGENLVDLEIPGSAYTFHTLLMAQVLGDGEALASRKYPLIRFHLKNREAGILELIKAFSA